MASIIACCDNCGEGYEENADHCIACGCEIEDDFDNFERLDKELDELDDIEDLRAIDQHIAKIQKLQKIVQDQPYEMLMSLDTLMKNFDDQLFGAKYRELYNLQIEYRDRSNQISADIRKIALNELVKMIK